MTKREAAIISAYTDFLLGDFNEVHKYIEEKLGRPVLMHEMASKKFQAEIRSKAKTDFQAIKTND